MNQFELRRLLVTMHRTKPDCKPMLRSIVRRRRTNELFTYTDGQSGVVTLNDYALYQMRSQGWIQVMLLDDTWEYISTTELGRAIVDEFNPRISESDWCAFLPDEAYTCWFGTPPYVGWSWNDAGQTITDRKEY